MLSRWRSRAHRVGEQWSTWREEWEVERELEQVLAGTQPVIVGPWLSEVGYEALYWVPFLRWVAAAYRIPEDRLIAVSRGGTASWYQGIASRYVEVLDHATARELSDRVADGVLKQRDISDFDRRLVRHAAQSLGLGAEVSVLHPSLMFRWFAPFWSGKETLGFAERHTRYTRVTPPAVTLPVQLPDEYVAVKLYAARSLPDGPAVRTQLRALVDGLSEWLPVVQLETGLGLDDHADYDLRTNERVISLSGKLDARTNLAVQTQVIAGAQMFVGTCGGLAWLAPLLGVATVPLLTDASFLHAHLHLARRVYGRTGAGSFSPVDLHGLTVAGLTAGRVQHPGDSERSS